MAEEKKNRSEELESLDKKIKRLLMDGIRIRKRLLNFYSSPAIFLRLFTTQHDAHCSTAKRSFTL